MNIKIQNLTVHLQNRKILDQVHLDIPQGKLISLLGVSGCGKSTLLKTIAGLIEQSQGQIYIGREEISGLPPEKRGAVIVFQDLRLFPHLSVEKNIQFPMEIKGIDKKQQQKRVKELLSAVQLEGFEKRMIRQMSGGQMQRVALARALAADPKVLLLDEPFSGLEENLRMEMGQLVKEIQEKSGITTILVTHQKDEALALSHKIALMSQGEILQYSSPHELYNHPVNMTVATHFGKVSQVHGKCYRPRGIRLSPQGQEYRVNQIAYLGDRVEITLEKEGHILWSDMDWGAFDALQIAQGDSVGIELPKESLFE